MANMYQCPAHTLILNRYSATENSYQSLNTIPHTVEFAHGTISSAFKLKES